MSKTLRNTKQLGRLLENEKYNTKYLKQLETRPKCPFKVLRFAGFARVMCDFSECTRNNSCDQDCKQAYMKAADIIPKRSLRRSK